MAVTIIISDEKLESSKSQYTDFESNKWYYLKPFWYKKNRYGTISVFDRKEIIQQQLLPKNVRCKIS